MTTASAFNFQPTGIGAMLRQGRLVVPPNQRSYAWRERHVDVLLKDLWSAIGNPTSGDYFLGTIVLVQSRGNFLSIVDGQQRLATVSIILARIRDYFSAMKRSGSAQAVQEAFLGHVDPRSEQIAPRIHLNDDDNEFFWTVILPPHPVDKPLDYGKTILRPSHRRLSIASEKARTYIADFLKPLPIEDRINTLIRWFDFLDVSAHVLAVTVQDEVSAFRLFETLNDRGLRASQTDILKNFFFSKAGEVRIGEAKNMWTRMTSVIEIPVDDRDDDDPDNEDTPSRGNPLLTYVRHSWITTHGHTKVKDLAAEIREEVTNDTRTMKYLSEWSSAADDYMALSSSKHPKWATYETSTKQNIEIISEHLRVTQIKPLLFAVARKFSPIEADKAFKLFVSWSVRFLIVGGRGGLLDTQYAQRAFDVGTGVITKASELRDSMKNVVPVDKEFEQAFTNARVSKSYLARYYLRALEKTQKDLPHPEYVANEDIRDVTLEHVMPFEATANWRVDPDVGQSAQKYIGNMVLLREPVNRDLGNKSWADKKAIFAQSGYFLTKMMCEYGDDWELDEIRDRQAKLAKIALKTWTLSFAV
jgi:hypothetical protein